MLFTVGLQQELAETKVRVQLVLSGHTATEIWDVAGIDSDAIDQTTVMTAEDCVDAALAGLDQGEAVTLPSVEDSTLVRIRCYSQQDVGSLAEQPACFAICDQRKQQALVT